jgi:hypothetical protein
MGHTHSWGDTLVTFAPPRAFATGVNVKGDDLALAVMYGLSTLTQECRDCREVRTWTVPGQAAVAPATTVELR